MADSTRVRLEKISPHAFEHPLDQAALLGLQKVPGLDWAVRKLVGGIGERRLRLLFLASAVRVTECQFSKIRKLYDEACDTLDIENPPELFVSQTFVVNAAAIGVDKPFIMLTSPLVEMLDDDELQCVLGHEIGHVMAGHALYTTILLLLINLWYVFLGIPGGIYAMIALRLALLEWSRKAELTADRAQMLVQRDFDSFVRCEMRFAAGCDYTRDLLSTEQFLIQAEEATRMQEEHILNRVYATIQMADTTHPFPVWRAGHMLKWVTEGTYLDILCGNYTRRDPPPQPDLEEEDSPVSINRMLDELRGLLGKTGL